MQKKSPKRGGICKAVIDLAHHFGTTAVAEGVENTADLQAIHEMGCDIGQGFLLAPPMPKADFIKLLQKRARHPGLLADAVQREEHDRRNENAHGFISVRSLLYLPNFPPIARRDPHP